MVILVGFVKVLQTTQIHQQWHGDLYLYSVRSLVVFGHTWHYGSY